MAVAVSAVATGPVPIISAPLNTAPVPTRRATGHRKAPTGVRAILVEHRTRFASFSVIGAAVFALGIALQALLTGRWHMSSITSFLLQGVVSVEVSFVLSHYWTWRDQNALFWRACGRFNAQKIIASIANLVVYAGLVKLGVNYLVANILTTAVFTVFNYASGHYWVFKAREQSRADTLVATSALDAGHLVPARIASAPDIDYFTPARTGTSLDEDYFTPAGLPLRRSLPTVSVIIPCRNNAHTIRATVMSLLNQDYPALEEVILVGSTRDSTWEGLIGIRDPRLVLLEQEATLGKRDPNVKRDRGIREARGEILALADSDIVMDPDWLSRAIPRLLGQGGGVIAGGMKSIHDSFWGRFVDRNVIAAKTPRLAKSYLVTARNFGHHGTRPPITANAVFTREVYANCPLDVTWAYGYEDYEWFWRVAKGGHKIRFASDISGAHHHRGRFRDLVTEYRRSATGCAHFIRAHPDSPLARKRRNQAILLPTAAAMGMILAGGVSVMGGGRILATLFAMMALVLMGREIAAGRRLEAAAYPYAGVALGVVFTFSLASNLIHHEVSRPVDAPVWSQSSNPNEQSRRLSATKGWLTAAFFFALATGFLLRFYELATKPDWQFDEAVYARISNNLLWYGTLNEHSLSGQQWQPFLYQPPFYPLILSRWFAITGPSIYHARILGVLACIAMLAVLWRLVHHIHGRTAALFVSVPIIFDGWLLYVERCSYMENLLMLIIAFGFLLYQRALERPSWQRFAVSGLILGFAVVFKHTGAYVALAVMLCWLILRRNHRGHLVLIVAILAVVIVYVAVMVRVFDVPGHDWYIYDTMVQLRRTGGLQPSGGTLTSPVKALHLLAAQYRVFIPSLAASVSGVLIGVKRTWQCWRGRSWQPLQGNVLLYAWMAAGVLVFGISSLKFPQYFALILIPTYAFLWTEMWKLDWSARKLLVILSIAVVAGVGSFWLRVMARDDNAFAATQTYAATSIPPRALVVTEESIGDLIRQPWCRVETASACPRDVAYAITWRTYLQNSFQLGGPAFVQMMKGAIPLKSFSGFSGTATVWRLR